MNLLIITDNIVYQTLLKASLEPFFENISIYEYFEENLRADIAIFAGIDTENEKLEGLAKKIPVFIVGKVNNIVPEHVTDFFLMPLRLGCLIEAVKHQIKYQNQKEKLKKIKINHFNLDPKTNELINTSKDISIILTEKEQEILLYLFDKNGKGVKRDKLLQDIWGYVDGVETHTLETHIYRLRKKIEDDPTNPKILITNDEGYYLSF